MTHAEFSRCKGWAKNKGKTFPRGNCKLKNAYANILRKIFQIGNCSEIND